MRENMDESDVEGFDEFEDFDDLEEPGENVKKGGNKPDKLLDAADVERRKIMYRQIAAVKGSGAYQLFAAVALCHRQKRQRRGGNMVQRKTAAQQRIKFISGMRYPAVRLE